MIYFSARDRIMAEQRQDMIAARKMAIVNAFFGLMMFVGLVIMVFGIFMYNAPVAVIGFFILWAGILNPNESNN